MDAGIHESKAHQTDKLQAKLQKLMRIYINDLIQKMEKGICVCGCMRMYIYKLAKVRERKQEI